MRCLPFLVGLALIGCSQSPHLAGGPIRIAPEPVVVRFHRPVLSPAGAAWELCYEFDRPDPSRQAGQITAALLDGLGQRHSLVESGLDRRGEAVVCLVGRPEMAEPVRISAAPSDTILFVAVELSADVPLTIRGLRGGPLRPR